MWIYIGVKIVLIILATICFYLGYMVGVKRCTKELENTLKETERDFPDDYTFGY